MAAMAAAELDPDLAGGEINIIMGNRQRIRAELIIGGMAMAGAAAKREKPDA